MIHRRNPRSTGVGFRNLFWEVTECSTPVSEGGFVLKSVCQHKTKGGNRLNFTYTNLDELPLTLTASEAAAVLRNSTVLYEGENKQKICALSPYVENASADGVAITADGVTDYLVASQTLITSNPVNINMSHALAKLVLNPTLGTEVTGDNIASVEVQNMYTQGTLNVEENNWTNCTGTTAFTMTNNEILVVPMEECQSFPIVITMSSGRVFRANISLANVDNKLEGGTQYTIKLQIGHDPMTIGDISAASWGTPISGGDLETE